jgi:hypothetical protein
MSNAEVSRLIASVTTLACSVQVFFLCLHNVSFGFTSLFTICKPNTAMQQSVPPPYQGVDGLAAVRIPRDGDQRSELMSITIPK